MKNLILAAGSGNRLRPYTNNIPKCLVSLSNNTILGWQLDVLSEVGIEKSSIVVGYKKDKILNLQEKRLDNFFFNDNYETTNMVKSLLHAEKLFSDNLIISYSDIIYSKDVYLKLLKSDYKNAIIVDLDWLKLWSKRFKNPLDDAETLKYDNSYNLTEIGNKTNNISNIMGQYIGLVKFDKFTLNLILEFDKQNKIYNNMFMTDLISLLIKRVNIKIIPISRGWIEVDTKNDFELYKSENIKSIKIYDLFK